MSETAPVRRSSGDVVEFQVLESLAADLPSVSDREGGGEADIVRRIFDAQNVEDLNSPWEQEGSKELVGRTLLITGLERGDSDMEGPLPFYLLVEATDQDNGKSLKFTTGSISIVAQLLRAHQLGQLPFIAKVVEAEKPTKQGFKPLHLQVIGRPF